MRTGIDDRTGGLLTGWDHCVQSLRLILTTRVGTLIMRRDFGGGLVELQDRNPSPREMMAAYTRITTAIRLWEPGFRLQKLGIVRAGADGIYRLDMVGVFYPRGHLGDYAASETRSTAIPGYALRTGGISFIDGATA